MNQEIIDWLKKSLSEHIIADAFETGKIKDGRLVERLIRERGLALAYIEELENTPTCA